MKVQQPGTSTWEAVTKEFGCSHITLRVRWGQKAIPTHTQLGQEAGNGGSTHKVKRQAEGQQPGTSKWEAVPKEFG